MADLGDRVSYEEAVALLDMIILDPESWLHARLADWKYPTTRAAMVLADLYDLTVVVNSGKGKRPKPYPRPWESTSADTTRVGRKNTRSPEETRAILARVSGRTKE